ncbi:collagen alpha-2(I) chain-like [Bos indicus]|uniref:Collagen alpha-2(I) chain-like n=3 Tax=Bos TaxID=9903 RepID=A0ABM4QSU3_BOSIN
MRSRKSTVLQSILSVVLGDSWLHAGPLGTSSLSLAGAQPTGHVLRLGQVDQSVPADVRIPSAPTLRRQKRSQHEPLLHFVAGAAGTTRSASPWAGAGPVVAGRPLRAFVPGSPGACAGKPRRATPGAAGPARPPRLSPGQPGAEPPPRVRGSAPSGRVRSAGGGRRAAGGRCGVAAGGGGAPRAVRCVPAAGRGRAPGRPRGARGSPRAPQSSDPSERQAGDSWSEGSSGRRRASRLEGSEEDWAVRVRAWLGLLPGQVQEEQAPGPEPPGGSTGIPRASPVRASRKSTGPPIPLVPRVEERPGSRCQSRGSTCGAMMLPLSTIGGQGREEVQTRPPQRRALPFERTTGQRREPARKNARVSAKQVPTCPMPGFCFAFYMDSKDSEFDSQPSPGSSRGGSKYTSPAKPRAKYKEIQAWECPLCCLSVLYIS